MSPRKTLFKSAVSPVKRFAAFFEDDGETAWFYLMDQALPEGDQIVGCTHVYDGAKALRQRDIEVRWTKDSRRVALLFKEEVVAAFDVNHDAM